MGEYLSEELEIACSAAREAGNAIMALYGTEYHVEEKARGQPVTAADLEANLRIQNAVLGRYPDDGWLSEENRDNGGRLSCSRVWVIDPIDGTKEFIECVPQFAVSIGLVIDGRPALGVVFNPAKDLLFAAVGGGGATLNGAPIRVSKRTDPMGARLLVSRSEPRRKFRDFENTYRLEPVGSIAYRLALVAGGEGDGTITFRSIHEWDVCAGVLIVKEAGGVVMDGDGQGLDFNQENPIFRGLVASNGSLGPEIQRRLAGQLRSAP